ncbi:MAG: SidJ-related pseudokinase, partial [Acidobacteriota bacterium]
YAPIPLFHNRVQRQRRSDQGLYEWPRGGRLDRWLESCRFPNFGLTGLRDLEHLISLDGSNHRLYQHIGTHILSLLLVAASYFRNRNKDLVGLDAEGKPVDARHLFDAHLLHELATLILKGYYEGFTGREYTGKPPFDLESLTGRMIDEMGVDRHMEEILRTPDQQQMTDEELRAFLAERGVSRPEEYERGVADIVIHTGPHLGGFNQRISLPEAIEFVASTSALCVAGKFLGERYSGGRLEGLAAAS